jgi:late competence protein required for DNA uptake (superfamily II DNA/RNA helicase)
MILDEFVKVTWQNCTKKYYEKRGYTYTKKGDVFLVKIIDLPETSKTMITCKCDICNSSKQIEYGSYKKCTNNLTDLYYCNNCIQTKIKQNNLKKYGVEYPQQNENIKRKN